MFLHVFVVSPGRTVGLVWRREMWWLELKWQSKNHKHTHTQININKLFHHHHHDTLHTSEVCCSGTQSVINYQRLWFQKAATDVRTFLAQCSHAHLFLWESFVWCRFFLFVLFVKPTRFAFCLKLSTICVNVLLEIVTNLKAFVCFVAV